MFFKKSQIHRDTKSEFRVKTSPLWHLRDFWNSGFMFVASQWFKSHGVTAMPWNSRDVSMCVYFYGHIDASLQISRRK